MVVVFQTTLSHFGWILASLEFLYSLDTPLFSSTPLYVLAPWSPLHPEDCPSCWFCLGMAIVDLFGQLLSQLSATVESLEWSICKTKCHLPVFNAFHRIPSIQFCTKTPLSSGVRRKEIRGERYKNFSPVAIF